MRESCSFISRGEETKDREPLTQEDLPHISFNKLQSSLLHILAVGNHTASLIPMFPQSRIIHQYGRLSRQQPPESEPHDLTPFLQSSQLLPLRLSRIIAGFLHLHRLPFHRDALADNLLSHLLVIIADGMIHAIEAAATVGS